MYSKEELMVYKSIVESITDIPKFMYVKKNSIYKNSIKKYDKNYNTKMYNKILYKKPNKKDMVGEYNEY